MRWRYCLLYGLPIAVSLAAAIRSLANPGMVPRHLIDGRLSRLLTLADLIVVVALFTALTSGAASYETPYRLHMRYYNFALPLLFIVAGAQLGASPARRSANMFIGLLIESAIVYAVIGQMEPYTPYLVDSPELQSITAEPALLLVLGVLSIATLAVVVCGSSLGIRLFVYGSCLWR